MADLLFNGKEHEEFFHSCLARSHRDETDPYYASLFYALGIAESSRRIINSLFDFKDNCIKPEGLHDPAQTSSSLKCCRLAFNLFTDSVPSDDPSEIEKYSVSDVFCCSYAPYFVQAIRIRYPQYF